MAKEKKEYVGANIPPELHAKLEKIAEEMDESMNKVIATGLEFFADCWAKLGEKK